MLKSLFYAALIMLMLSTQVLAFDHSHTEWDGLLKQYVLWDEKGVASQVDYAGFKRDEARLERYLDDLSKVSKEEFSGWGKSQQLAFLINAYNAFTVELILTRYPDLKSIKQLGSIFSSPWSKRFFHLLGKDRTLDEVEHEMIREPGVYDDPRIHVAVVCASIGCPGIRDEAFVAERIEPQLEDSLRRFLSDRSRNRYHAGRDRLQVSKIFDWYEDDFAAGFRKRHSLAAFLGDYAELLAGDKNTRQRIAAGQIRVEYLDYDWALNDLGR